MVCFLIAYLNFVYMTLLSLYEIIYFDLFVSNSLQKSQKPENCPFSTQIEIALDSTILTLVIFKYIVVFCALRLSMFTKACYCCIEILIFALLALINCYSDIKLIVCAALLSIGTTFLYFMFSILAFNLRLVTIGISWKERESRYNYLKA